MTVGRVPELRFWVERGWLTEKGGGGEKNGWMMWMGWVGMRALG
jgi:hypothetical protein